MTHMGPIRFLCVLAIAAASLFMPAQAHAMGGGMGGDMHYDPNFTPGQRQTVWDAHVTAMSAVVQALTVLEDNRGRIMNHRFAPYREWFGPAAPQTYKQVMATYEQTLQVMQGEFYYYDAHMDDTWGYSYQDTPGSIWLGGDFWDAGMTGYDSQMGMIVHEASQWLGANDWMHGVSGAQNAASISAGLAADNADNYRYFMESLW